MMTIKDAITLAEEYKKNGVLSTPAKATIALADFIKDLIGSEAYKQFLDYPSCGN